jgi:hypothetical protein
MIFILGASAAVDAAAVALGLIEAGVAPGQSLRLRDSGISMRTMFECQVLNFFVVEVIVARPVLGLVVWYTLEVLGSPAVHTPAKRTLGFDCQVLGAVNAGCVDANLA